MIGGVGVDASPVDDGPGAVDERRVATEKALGHRGSHPDSVVYQLLMGDVNSKRDRQAAGHLLTSLDMMEFAPDGTNFPHHRDAEEEIYILLDGSGEMVAESGMDGREARFPARPGDAYFFRLNCTVGFYNISKQSAAHILAVRSTYPRGDR